MANVGPRLQKREEDDMSDIGTGKNYKYVTQMYCGDQAGENVRYFNVTSQSAGPTDQLTFQTQLDVLVSSYYTAMMSTLSYFRRSWIYDMTALPAPLPTENVYGSGTYPGTLASQNLPSQVSGVYTTTTGSTGRKNRGRQYVPFPTILHSQNVANPIPTATYAGLIADMATFFDASEPVTVSGNVIVITWQLYHRSTNTFTPLNGWRNQNLWGTQRRRGGYGRPNP